MHEYASIRVQCGASDLIMGMGMGVQCREYAILLCPCAQLLSKWRSLGARTAISDCGVRGLEVRHEACGASRRDYWFHHCFLVGGCARSAPCFFFSLTRVFGLVDILNPALLASSIYARSRSGASALARIALPSYFPFLLFSHCVYVNSLSIIHDCTTITITTSSFSPIFCRSRHLHLPSFNFKTIVSCLYNVP